MGDYMNIISKKYNAWKLNRMQATIDKEIQSKDFDNEILEKQIRINKRRNKLDIPDPKELNDNGFAQ